MSEWYCRKISIHEWCCRRDDNPT